MTFASVVGAQWMALRRRPMTWILGVVLLAYMVLVFGSFAVLLSAPPGEAFDAELLLGPIRAGGPAYLAQLYGSIASILIIVLASSLAGHEFSRGTLRTLLLSRVPRGTLIGAMLAVLGAVGVIAAAIGVLVTLIAGQGVGAAAGEDLLRLQGPRHLLLMSLSLFFRLGLMLGTWAILAFSMTLLTRSLLAGIGGTLAFQLIGGVAAGLLASLGDVGVYAGRFIVTTAIDRVTVPPVLDLSSTDIAWVTANLLAYLALPTWWAIHRFRRMDVLAATR